MIFTPLEIAGAYLIDIEPIVDERGFFARTWCQAEFAQRGLPGDWPQSNIAWSANRGTLRGLHFVDAQDEAKLVPLHQRRRLCSRRRYSNRLTEPGHAGSESS